MSLPELVSALRWSITLATAFARWLALPITLAARLIGILLSPVTEPARYFLNWIPVILLAFAALRPLYIFLGCAAIVGIITGTFAYGLSTTLTALFPPPSPSSPPTSSFRPRHIKVKSKAKAKRNSPPIKSPPTPSHHLSIKHPFPPQNQTLPSPPSSPDFNPIIGCRAVLGARITQAQRMRLQRLHAMRRQVSYLERKTLAGQKAAIIKEEDEDEEKSSISILS